MEIDCFNAFIALSFGLVMVMLYWAVSIWFAGYLKYQDYKKEIEAQRLL